MDERTKYNKLIGRIGDEYYFLDEIFKHSDDFQGATATVLTPVSKEEYDETMTVEGLKDRGYDDLWRQSVDGGHTEQGLDDWLEDVLAMDGDEGIWDFSGSQYWDDLRELGLSEEEYPVFNCTGGGRSFSRDMEFDEIYNEELWQKIQEVEK